MGLSVTKGNTMTSPSGMKATTIESNIVSRLKRNRRVIAAYLFGSQAKGKARTNSDIDIALLLRGRRHENYSAQALEITCDVMKAAGVDRIDILILNTATPIARHQVYLHGRRIFCRDERQAMRFKDLSIAEYLDFLPFRRQGEEALFKKISGGRHG